MRSLTLLTVTFLPCIMASAVDADWKPSASIEEKWRWNELEELNDYAVYAAAEGVNGDLWFAYEDGILNYDGWEVTTYTMDLTDPTKTADLYVSSDGRVFWVHGNSLIIKDGDKYLHHVLDGEIFVDNNGLVEDQHGNIIVATYGGLYLLADGDLKPIDGPSVNPSSILLDSHGNLWVAGYFSHLIQVFQLNIDQQNLTSELLYEFGENSETGIHPKLFLDSKDRVWIIDPDSQDQCYLYDNYQKQPVLKGLKEASLWMQNMSITEMASGDFWFAVHRRLGHYDGERLTVYDIGELPIPSTYPYMLGLPEDKLLLGGINLVPQLVDLSTENWSTYTGLNFQSEDVDGGLWFISHDRRVVHKAGQDWEVFDASDGLIDTPNRIITGSDGSIWASGSHKEEAAVAYRLNGTWHAFEFPMIGKVFSHLACLETMEGNFLFGGGTPTESDDMKADGGAVMFRKVGQHYQPVHLPPPTLIRRPANIVERSGDGLWLSMASIYKAYTPNSLSAQEIDLFTNQWVDHMIVDRNMDVWVACLGVGIYQYNGNAWILHDSQDGMDLRNVLYLLEDTDNGGLLALSTDGFYRYDGSNWGHWDIQTNLPFKRENHTVFQDSDGAIWINFASRSWYLEGEQLNRPDQFQTVRYNPDSDPPETRVSSLISVYGEGDLVHFRFDGSDYWDDTSSHDLMYSWSLNGRDWSDFINLSELTVNDLDAGEFLLQVRARDKVGNIDPTPAMATFRIVPPIWKQAWFILLILGFVSLIVVLLYALFKVRLKAALAIDEFKLDFFTNISHELRNPLAVMITPIERLLRSNSDPDTRHNLRIVLRNARKMQGMIDQLLEFRKIEKGKWMLNPSGGELVSFLRETIYNEEPLWLEKEQVMEFSASPDSWLCSFDPEIFQKIVDNLVSNAIKYSGQNTKIRIDLRVKPADGHEECILVVEDEGIGIPLHEQENILKPFYRIKHKGIEEGSGVGLALVNQLVKICGGALEISSPVPETNSGTRFTVTLPLEPFRETAEPEFVYHTEDSEGEGKPCVLIVEDNDDFRHVLSNELSEIYQVIESSEGANGFEKACMHNPDLIISDIMMPGMDGYQLCDKLKSDPETSHIPVILLTAKSSVDHRVEGIKVGADAYIAKPLEMKHLLARMENLLESRRELKHKFAHQIVVEPTELTVTPTDELILRKAIQIVDEHMRDEDFDVAHLSKLMGMSRSSLTRKLKAMTGQTPQPFIQKMRLKRAASLLASGNFAVSEAAAQVGIFDLSYFAKIFRREFGMLPSNYGSSDAKTEALREN